MSVIVWWVKYTKFYYIFYLVLRFKHSDRLTKLQNHIISCHIIYHIISHHITSHQITSYHIISYHIISRADEIVMFLFNIHRFISLQHATPYVVNTPRGCCANDVLYNFI